MANLARVLQNITSWTNYRWSKIARMRDNLRIRMTKRKVSGRGFLPGGSWPSVSGACGGGSSVGSSSLLTAPPGPCSDPEWIASALCALLLRLCNGNRASSHSSSESYSSFRVAVARWMSRNQAPPAPVFASVLERCRCDLRAKLRVKREVRWETPVGREEQFHFHETPFATTRYSSSQLLLSVDIGTESLT